MLNNFSPNALKTFDKCPKKFYFQYVEKIKVPHLDTPFEKGKKIHALANYFLQEINIENFEKALSPEEYIVWQNLKNNSFYQKKCLKTEFSLMCKIGDYWVGGRLDAIVKDGENYYILDYKTGEIPQNPEYDFQTMIYLLCLDRYLKNYKTLSFVYIDLKNNKNIIIEFSSSKREQYEEKIKSICDKILNEKAYKCSCAECKYCEFSKICIKG